MWECGLKLFSIRTMTAMWRHSLCGSVDWNCAVSTDPDITIGHSLCGSVDWNHDPNPVTEPIGSHSLCGSVDWNRLEITVGHNRAVTPYVGVWIETGIFLYVSVVRMSLLMWECGLKHLGNGSKYNQKRHSLCGSVDWNRIARGESLGEKRHSLCGSVDWNILSLD